MDYVIKQFPDKKFVSKMDQTRFIKENFDTMKQIKMAEYKTGSFAIIDNIEKKEFEPMIEPITSDVILVKSVINSTNIIDSHRDLHLQDIWNKTTKDNPYSYHLKQHESIFESVISNKAKSYNEKSNFNEIGLKSEYFIEISSFYWLFGSGGVRSTPSFTLASYIRKEDVIYNRSVSSSC